MMQPTETQSADVRRALDRLQETLEALADRYRELRRERRLLRTQIEELQQEREGAEATVQSRLETAAVDRRRAIELEDRAAQAEKRNAELHDRLRELEVRLAERESFIVGQEEEITSLRSRIESDREQEAVEDERRTSEQIETLQAEVGELRQRLADVQAERGRLEEQQRQLVAKLDASTRDAGLARTRVAELEGQLRQTETAVAELEEKNAQSMSQLEQAGEERRAVEAERDRVRSEIGTLRERLTQAASGDDERLRAMRAEIESLTSDLSDALDMAARKELEVVEKSREMESLRRSLDDSNRQSETLRSRCKELTAEVERRVVESASLNGSAVHEEDRRDMVEQIRQAIRLIDKHLEGT